MKYLILIFLLPVSFLTSGQKSAIIDVLKDTAIHNAQVIAIGEASHGISEFQTLRRDLFWELQRQLRFNTIFLEAGYAECFKINQYIKNKTNTPLIVLLVYSLGYYPWTKPRNLCDEWFKKN